MRSRLDLISKLTIIGSFILTRNKSLRFAKSAVYYNYPITIKFPLNLSMRNSTLKIYKNEV